MDKVVERRRNEPDRPAVMIGPTSQWASVIWSPKLPGTEITRGVVPQKKKSPKTTTENVEPEPAEATAAAASTSPGHDDSSGVMTAEVARASQEQAQADAIARNNAAVVRALEAKEDIQAVADAEDQERKGQELTSALAAACAASEPPAVSSDSDTPQPPKPPGPPAFSYLSGSPEDMDSELTEAGE